MKELSLEEAALAWAQGKRVEAEAIDANDGAGWELICLIGGAIGKQDPNVFIAPVLHRFRLAPEPPAKKWRPYTRSQIEKHLGAQVQHKGRGYSAIIIAVLEEAVHIGMSHYTFETLLNDFTWSDGSPCGVEVDA